MLASHDRRRRERSILLTGVDLTLPVALVRDRGLTLLDQNFMACVLTIAVLIDPVTPVVPVVRWKIAGNMDTLITSSGGGVDSEVVTVDFTTGSGANVGAAVDAGAGVDVDVGVGLSAGVLVEVGPVAGIDVGVGADA